MPITLKSIFFISCFTCLVIYVVIVVTFGWNRPAKRVQTWGKLRTLDRSRNIAINILNEWGISGDQFVVIHWPRGEQIISNCRHVDDYTFDFSVNCDIPEKFIHIASRVKANHMDLPIYIATNEVDAKVLGTLHRLGFYTYNDFAKNFSSNFDDIASIEFGFMQKAKFVYGAGQSPVHSSLQYHRALEDAGFSWIPLPGNNNVITDMTPKTEQSSTTALENMIVKLNATVTPGELDAIVLNFHVPEIASGRMKQFFSEMKKVSASGHLPPFYFVSYSPVSEEDRKSVLELLSTLDLLHQFKSIHFVSFHEENDVHRITTHSTKSYSAFNGPNALFYETMSYMSTQNVSVILLLEPDVKFLTDFWFDKLRALSQMDTFWIYGSQYKGLNYLSSRFRCHLNGVALYNVGDPSFSDFIQLLKAYHKYYDSKYGEINYDVIWSILMSNYCEREKLQVANALRVANSNLLFTNTILNFSPRRDMNTSREEIRRRYKLSILLHQK